MEIGIFNLKQLLEVQKMDTSKRLVTDGTAAKIFQDAFIAKEKIYSYADEIANNPLPLLLEILQILETKVKELHELQLEADKTFNENFNDKN